MARSRAYRSGTRTAGTVLALTALAVQVLALFLHGASVAGWIGSDGSGGQMVLCTVDGPKTVPAPDGQDGAPGPLADQNCALCKTVGALAAACPAPDLGLADIVAWDRIVPTATDQQVLASWQARAFRSRAPPAATA